ncbi:hypothetical protein TNCV_4129361 [Trichonephila clavipes]|nr:hypothetical protein TNCV_4129361 [Trichonephila clavipes]
MKSLHVAPGYECNMDRGFYPNNSHQSEFLPGTQASQCDHRVRSLPKPLFHPLRNCVFQQCWIDDIWCFVPSRLADALNRYPV